METAIYNRPTIKHPPRSPPFLSKPMKVSLSAWSEAMICAVDGCEMWRFGCERPRSSTHLQDGVPKILCSCQIHSNSWLGSSIFLSIWVKHPSRHQGAPWSGPHSTDQQWCARRPCSGWGFGDDMSCHVEKGLWQTGKIVILHDYGKLPEANTCCFRWFSYERSIFQPWKHW